MENRSYFRVVDLSTKTHPPDPDRAVMPFGAAVNDSFFGFCNCSLKVSDKTEFLQTAIRNASVRLPFGTALMRINNTVCCYWSIVLQNGATEWNLNGISNGSAGNARLTENGAAKRNLNGDKELYTMDWPKQQA